MSEQPRDFETTFLTPRHTKKLDLTKPDIPSTYPGITKEGEEKTMNFVKDYLVPKDKVVDISPTKQEKECPRKPRRSP